jgi:hypothetical protein
MKALLKEKELRKRIDHLRGCALVGMRNLTEANALWRLAVAEDEPHRRDAPASRSAIGGVGAADMPLVGGADALGGGGGGGSGGVTLATVRAAAASKGHTTVPSAVPASTLLATDESKACLSLGLAAAQYAACKRRLIVEASVRAPAPLSVAQAQAALRGTLDGRRAAQFWSHCVRNGWLAPPRE